MPDAYLHRRTALAAARRCSFAVEDADTFILGAQGPDPFFAYHLWGKKELFSAETLGHRLHSTHTDKLLCEMARLADTPARRSFAAGFVTHAVLDSVLHPYINTIACTKDSFYAKPGGHCLFESALDTYFYRYDHKKKFEVCRPDKLCPTLTAERQADVCSLMRDAAAFVLEEKPDVLELSDCYHRFRWARKFFYSPFGGKKLLARFADAVLHSPGKIIGHMQPACLKDDLPVCEINGSFIYAAGELLPIAEKEAARMLTALSYLWAGRISYDKFCTLIVCTNWLTGNRCAGE